MRGLYAIVDIDSLERAGLEPLAFTEAVLAARPAAVQLRDKSCRHGGAHMYELLRKMAPMCRARSVPLFANDRADLAALSGCDGVHVGQRDVPVAAARSVVGRRRRGLVGISTHSEAEVEAAIADRPDYVAIGPVFATASKAAADPPIGLDGLARLSARLREAMLSVVAIGGIDRHNAREVAGLCDAGAVIAALVPAGESEPYARVAERAAALHEALRGSP